MHQLLEGPAARVSDHVAQVGIEIEILHHRQVFIEAEALRHIADDTVDVGGVAPRVEAANLDPALAGQQQVGHQPHQRRLAGTIRADQAGDVPAAKPRA